MTDDALCRPRGEAWWTRMASGGRVPTPRGFDRGHHRPSATFAHDVCNICSALESSTWQAAPFASQAPHLPRLRMIVEGLHIRHAGGLPGHPPTGPARTPPHSEGASDVVECRSARHPPPIPSPSMASAVATQRHRRTLGLHPRARTRTRRSAHRHRLMDHNEHNQPEPHRLMTSTIVPPRPCLDCHRLTHNGARCIPCTTKRKGSKVDRYGPGWDRISRQVIERDGGVCWLCGGEGATTTDHLLDRNHPDRNHPDNMRAAHRTCNSRRGKPAAT